jgi:hypothetical protein
MAHFEQGQIGAWNHLEPLGTTSALIWASDNRVERVPRPPCGALEHRVAAGLLTKVLTGA